MNCLKLLFPIVLIACIILTTSSCKETKGQSTSPQSLKEDLAFLLESLEEKYIYFEDKGIDIECLKKEYGEIIKNITSERDAVLCFEYVLDEFYDSHLILNTNIKSSYRLYSPLHTETTGNKTTIKNVWLSQITDPLPEIIGSEILEMNGKSFNNMIAGFPTLCQDKTNPVVRTWIGNKIVSGRYNEPRILSLKLINGNLINLNLDSIDIRKNDGLLKSERVNNIGIIRINNSLGNNDLVESFDKTLDGLMDTEGLVIDLRNTVDGGDASIAKPIMGRFISKKSPYQIHESHKKKWTEYVKPRKKQYRNKVVVLVDRWTGSMGEGMAIGFEGMNRATIMGTEMERLAGAMNGINFNHRKYGFRISTEKLYHVNGTPREDYIPSEYVEQTTVQHDELLESALSFLRRAE